MIFNTAWFLVFFAIFYAGLAFVSFVARAPRVTFLYVLVASAVFHFHFAGPAGVLPIVAMGLSTYLFGLLLGTLRVGSSGRRLAFAAGVAVPVLGLLFYKYQGLLRETLSSRPVDASGNVVPALPLAISFFTFEFVHYLTDVARGSRPIRDPLRFSFFAIFFPSIVSGPIKRYQPFLAQVENGLLPPRSRDVLAGAAQVLLGFFKKLVVADNAAVLIELLEKHPAPTRGLVLALAALLSVRILFDFSGYSDIAIGLGRMVGLELPKNFNFPYAARNLAEFWQRWHMSLSSWIRDYVYIPLGGGRSGLLRKALNLSVTMFLCGLWHGPAWHFGLWGLYHGVGLAVHAGWEKAMAGRRTGEGLFPRLAGTAITDLFVAYGWLLFFYPLDRVVGYTRLLLGLSPAVGGS